MVVSTLKLRNVRFCWFMFTGVCFVLSLHSDCRTIVGLLSSEPFRGSTTHSDGAHFLKKPGDFTCVCVIVSSLDKSHEVGIESGVETSGLAKTNVEMIHSLF